ncbi:hypothetical protein [Melghirimyces profundicolus]|nr:hypothetical protein [Melghirimyces profundicolus]
MNRMLKAMIDAVPTTFRLFLATNFLIYGVAKLTMGQFGESPEILEARGEGFATAWSFFGYSRAYEIFIGLGEVGAALLLLIPLTRTWGALISFPIALNVMMVNYCFNIGVQDLSTVLVAMNVYLLWIGRKKFEILFDREETGTSQERVGLG